MLKKIALVMLLALPMGVFAQNLKFGHINAQEIITVMPEFTKAQNDIQTLEKQLTAELQRTQEEFNKKYQEFQQAIAKDSLPPNIAENNWRWSTLSSFFCGCTSLRPEATAPEEIRMISTPDLCNSAIWSTSADIRVTSSVPSRRVNTLLPTFTAIRVNSCFIPTNDLKAQI
jgi:hypothetical protein